MDRFLTIKSLYESPDKRTIEDLSNLYTHPGKLEEEIKDLISPFLLRQQVEGKRILLKPNWVKHSFRPFDEICLRTNDHFLLAVLEIILQYKPLSVVIGDAPIQGCRWSDVVDKTLISVIDGLSDKYNIPVQVMDFRRRTYSVVNNNPESELRPLNDYLIFDLGNKSYLEEITESGKNNFRVTNYDPDRMSSAHSPGVHKYCITKAFFDADIVISLPKIKTHQKAGITGAVKNLVGINGDKDFLPHHRIGGTKFGGDCYPGNSRFRLWSELMLDKANRNQGKSSFWFWQKFSSLLWKLSFPGPEHQIAAGWYGNDTTWRMVMDLNMIAGYGRADGSLSDKPVRSLYSISDAIVGGQGNGPLEPDPLPLGVISFTNDSFANDRAMAVLMNFPYEKIPILRHSFNDSNYNLIMNGRFSTIEGLSKYSIKTNPPIGWANIL